MPVARAASASTTPLRSRAPRLRRALALGLAAIVAAGLTACGSQDPTDAGVTVVGDPLVPQLDFRAPLEVTDTSSIVVAEGTGPTLVEDEPVLLDYRLVSAADGSLIEQTYTSVPKVFRLNPENLGGELYDALRGTTVGSRVIVLVPADAEGVQNASVLLVDVRSTRATGEVLDPRPGLPEVVLGDDGAPSIAAPEGDPPTELIVETLIKGTGAQVAAGATISAQFTEYRWSNGAMVDSTWDRAGPASFTLAGVVQGWAEGLVEQTVGSQVLLVVPPAYAFGGVPDHELSEETLVYVIDILATSQGETPPDDPSPSGSAEPDDGATTKDE